MRVLIIDDEADVRMIARLSLSEMGGMDVLEAESGVLGIEIASTQPIDGILLDVSMPNPDGLETFRMLRSNAKTRSIPVVFVTARVHDADIRELTDLGASGVLSKPFDVVELPARLRELFGSADDVPRTEGLR